MMKKIRELPEVKEAIPKNKLEERDINIKPVCLLMAYMLGVLEPYGLTGEETEKELEIILRAVPNYLDIIIQATVALSTLFKMGRTSKRITCRNILAVIQFSQNLMQGGW